MSYLAFIFGRLRLIGVAELSSAPAAEPVAKKYPQPFPIPPWLNKPQVLDLDIQPDEKWAPQRATMTCSGTNAGGYFFVWDGKDRIYDLVNNKDVDVKFFQNQVKQAHAYGLKPLCPLIRMWHPDLLIDQHPDWQELPTPTSKPLGSGDRKRGVMPNGRDSPFGDFYIQQSLEIAKRLKWDGYNLDGFGTWCLDFNPMPARSTRPRPGRTFH